MFGNTICSACYMDMDGLMLLLSQSKLFNFQNTKHNTIDNTVNIHEKDQKSSHSARVLFAISRITCSEFQHNRSIVARNQECCDLYGNFRWLSAFAEVFTSTIQNATHCARQMQKQIEKRCIFCDWFDCFACAKSFRVLQPDNTLVFIKALSR